MQAWRDLSIAGSFSLLGAFRCWELFVAGNFSLLGTFHCWELSVAGNFPLLQRKKAPTRLPPFPPLLLLDGKLPPNFAAMKRLGAKEIFLTFKIEYVSGSKTSYCTEFIEPKTRVTVHTLLRVILIAFSTLISSPCIFETCYTGSN